MQKGSVLIFLLAGIFILTTIGGIFYLGRKAPPKAPTPTTASQAPQPTLTSSTNPTEKTANWKVYSGRYFSFQYPESWEEKPFTSQNPKHPFVGSMFSCPTSNILNATVSNISLYPTLESYLSGRWLGASPAKTVLLDGLRANYYEDPGDPGSSNPAVNVVLYSPSKGVVIDLYFANSCGESFQQIKTELDSIISTFKFNQ